MPEASPKIAAGIATRKTGPSKQALPKPASPNRRFNFRRPSGASTRHPAAFNPLCRRLHPSSRRQPEPLP